MAHNVESLTQALRTNLIPGVSISCTGTVFLLYRRWRSFGDHDRTDDGRRHVFDNRRGNNRGGRDGGGAAGAAAGTQRPPRRHRPQPAVEGVGEAGVSADAIRFGDRPARAGRVPALRECEWGGAGQVGVQGEARHENGNGSALRNNIRSRRAYYEFCLGCRASGN